MRPHTRAVDACSEADGEAQRRRVAERGSLGEGLPLRGQAAYHPRRLEIGKDGRGVLLELARRRRPTDKRAVLRSGE